MARFITVMFLLVSTLSFGAPAFAQDAEVCGEIESYFHELDGLMWDGMKDYFKDEDWMKQMERMSRKADASDSGLLTLSPDEMQPFIDIITVPGDVMLDFPEDEIPEEVVPFHESSMSYWLIMPAMMKTIGSGGMLAAMVFTEDLESAAADNLIALESLGTMCPALVSQMTEADEASEIGDLLEEFGAVDADAIEDIESPEGFAFGLMIVPAEEAGE